MRRGPDPEGRATSCGRLTPVEAPGLLATASAHLDCRPGGPAGKCGGNFRNGTRSKTVLTDVGSVETAIPRDRDRRIGVYRRSCP
ncbi:transposase [Streptomyces sp. NPDC059340]|uniref:transposase n=1 Tax=Streptomyces sp. NPDC059340 TaxID=3346806 RepID=UPI003679FB7F